MIAKTIQLMIGGWVRQSWWTNSVTWDTVLCTTRHERDGCCATTPSTKSFLFPNDLLNLLIWYHIPAPRNWPSLQQHTGFDTHVTAPHTRDGCMWLTSTVVVDHAMTLTSTPSKCQTSHSFIPLSALIQHALAWGHSATVPTSLFGDCVTDTLSTGSLPEAHKWWLWNKHLPKLCCAMCHIVLCCFGNGVLRKWWEKRDHELSGEEKKLHTHMHIRMRKELRKR